MKSIKLFMVMALGILIYSCSPKITMVDTSCPGYRHLDFTVDNIYKEGIGVMPVLGGQGKEQYRRPMGDAINKYFILKFGQDKIKSPSNVIESLNDANLTAEYANAIETYQITGIVPREMVIKLGSKLNTKYLLYTRLLSDSEVEVFYYQVYGHNFRKSTTVDEIYVECQVWDTQKGDVVWEGKAGTAKTIKDPTNIVDETGRGISNVVGIDKDGFTCKGKNVIFKSSSDAQAKTFLGFSAAGLGCLFTLLLMSLFV